jgi:ABC-type Fe3+-hydroxamate transport system substrate-binding protein
MVRRILVLCALFVFVLASCTGAQKGSSANGETSEKQVGGTVSSTVDKSPEPSDSPYSKMLEIFKGYSDLVEKYKTSPAVGASECGKYAEANIPKIKELEPELRNLANDPANFEKLRNLNQEIKEISDSIAKTVTESYGMDGAEVLLKLSDMMLARLDEQD